MNGFPNKTESSVSGAGCNSDGVRLRLSRITDSYSRLESLLDEYESKFDEDTVTRLIEFGRISKPR